jgi:signal transduction histidine kinase
VQDLSLHILDVAENSIRADAKLIEIFVLEEEEQDMLTVEIRDDGRGMDKAARKRAVDPFYTTKSSRRVGLGLALLAQAAREAEGSFELTSAPGAGTEVKAVFRYSHPDRKPLGDMAATVETLVTGNPGVDFVYEHRKGMEGTRFDTRKIRES